MATARRATCRGCWLAGLLLAWPAAGMAVLCWHGRCCWHGRPLLAWAPPGIDRIDLPAAPPPSCPASAAGMGGRACPEPEGG